MAGLAKTLSTLSRPPRPATSPMKKSGRRMTEVTGFGPNPGGLKMLAYVPAEVTARPALVVVLHGCTQHGETYAASAGWLDLADRAGFVVVAPEQSRGNNPNLCFSWYQPGDVARAGGEAGSIRQMVVHAVGAYDIDPARVFVTGLSAGGGMAAAMLATSPDLFAAGAVIAGLPYGSAGNVQEAFRAMGDGQTLSGAAWGDKVRAGAMQAGRAHAGPWPRVSIWQGVADTTVRPGVADQLARQWADVHGVKSGPQSATTPGGRSYRVWRGASGEAVVAQHMIPAMGHGTPVRTGPGGLGTAGAHFLDVGVSSTLEIAADWGLVSADALVADVQPAPKVARTEPSRATRPVIRPTVKPRAPAATPASGGVLNVIEQALRSAGLMK